eukprot:Nk52_evm18s263 gene=Nk52_evmTU18s263
MNNTSVPIIALLMLTVLLITVNINKARGAVILPVRYDNGTPSTAQNQSGSIAPQRRTTRNNSNNKGHFIQFCGDPKSLLKDHWIEFAPDAYYTTYLNGTGTYLTNPVVPLPDLDQYQTFYMRTLNYNHVLDRRPDSFGVSFRSVQCGNVNVSLSKVPFHSNASNKPLYNDGRQSVKFTVTGPVPEGIVMTLVSLNTWRVKDLFYLDYACGNDVTCPLPIPMRPELSYFKIRDSDLISDHWVHIASALSHAKFNWLSITDSFVTEYIRWPERNDLHDNVFYLTTKSGPESGEHIRDRFTNIRNFQCGNMTAEPVQNDEFLKVSWNGTLPQGSIFELVPLSHGTPLTYDIICDIPSFNVKGFALKFCEETISNFRARISESWEFEGGDNLSNAMALGQHVKMPSPKIGNVLYVQIFHKNVPNRGDPDFARFSFPKLTCGNITMETVGDNYHLKLTFNGEVAPNSVVTFGPAKKWIGKWRENMIDLYSAFCGDMQCDEATKATKAIGFNLNGFALDFCDEFLSSSSDYRIRVSESWDHLNSPGDILYIGHQLEKHFRIPYPKKGNVVYATIFLKTRSHMSKFTFGKLTCGNITVETEGDDYHLKLTFNGAIPPNSVVSFGPSKTWTNSKYDLEFDSAFCGVQCYETTSSVMALSTSSYSTETTSIGSPTTSFAHSTTTITSTAVQLTTTTPTPLPSVSITKSTPASSISSTSATTTGTAMVTDASSDYPAPSTTSVPFSEVPLSTGDLSTLSSSTPNPSAVASSGSLTSPSVSATSMITSAVPTLTSSSSVQTIATTSGVLTGTATATGTGMVTQTDMSSDFPAPSTTSVPFSEVPLSTGDLSTLSSSTPNPSAVASSGSLTSPGVSATSMITSAVPTSTSSSSVHTNATTSGVLTGTATATGTGMVTQTDMSFDFPAPSATLMSFTSTISNSWSVTTSQPIATGIITTNLPHSKVSTSGKESSNAIVSTAIPTGSNGSGKETQHAVHYSSTSDPSEYEDFEEEIQSDEQLDEKTDQSGMKPHTPSEADGSTQMGNFENPSAHDIPSHPYENKQNSCSVLTISSVTLAVSLVSVVLITTWF